MTAPVDRSRPRSPSRGRDATVGSEGGRRAKRRRGGGDQSMVPEATFTSYYGRPILKEELWKADIPA